MVEENPLISLIEIKRRLFETVGVSVSTTTIHKHLEGKFYSIKQVRSEPVSMNSDVNKEKRRTYVENIMKEIGSGNDLIYIDETNCNLFLRRTNGRSKKGTRCIVKAPTSKGKNIHIIAGISQTGLIYWERLRGSYTKVACNEWLQRLLRNYAGDYSKLSIVCDNAPVHVDIEKIAEEEEFCGINVIRLAPYSSPLNPIEECWSVLKSKIKEKLSVTMQEMLTSTPPHGVTLTEYRLGYLERVIDESIPAITPTLCMKTCNHVQKYFSDCLSLKNLQMGDIM